MKFPGVASLGHDVEGRTASAVVPDPDWLVGLDVAGHTGSVGTAPEGPDGHWTQSIDIQGGSSTTSGIGDE